MSRKNRGYTLIFGSPINVSNDFFIDPLTRGAQKTISLDNFYNENDPNAYLIDKHNISFTITKTDEANNTAEITVDNLHPDTIDYLLDNRANGLVVVFKAGYLPDEVKLLFQGTMKDCYVSKIGDTSKTKIILVDGIENTTK